MRNEIYAEEWVEDAQGGHWEVLRRADGGFYRGFRLKEKRIRERRREDEMLAQ